MERDGAEEAGPSTPVSPRVIFSERSNPESIRHIDFREAPDRVWDMWRVLVVEDDALQAEHVSDLLVEEGMEPIGPASTSEAALSLLDTESVDAAILDIRLRNGLCFEVAHTLMARRIPFLFLTGSAREVLPTRFRTVPLLHKPCEPATLFDVLRAMLRRNRTDAD